MHADCWGVTFLALWPRFPIHREVLLLFIIRFSRSVLGFLQQLSAGFWVSCLWAPALRSPDGAQLPSLQSLGPPLFASQRAALFWNTVLPRPVATGPQDPTHPSFSETVGYTSTSSSSCATVGSKEVSRDRSVLLGAGSSGAGGGGGLEAPTLQPLSLQSPALRQGLPSARG